MTTAGLLTLGEAVDCLRRGRVIAYPTEAVYGLGCDPTNQHAVHSILELKSRPASMGLILIASDFSQLEPYLGPLEDEARDRAMAAWPGPVTWLFPRAEGVPDWLAGSHPTIAVRLSAHPLCRALCASFGGAIVSTSANPRCEDPARTPAEVTAYFGSALCGIAEGELGGDGRPSEIRDLASGRVLRRG